MLPYKNQMRDFEYNIETKTIKAKRKGEKTRIKKYCNDIFTFDIEVTSAWVDNGKIIGYTPNKSNEYWNNLQALSLPYIWQFGINENIYYGRELWEFENVLADIPSDIEIIIWVHNLSYEFVFLCNFLYWKNVFARQPHKPMKAIPYKYQNIEFRCSYMLTRLSLDAWGKQIGVKKFVGDLDYEKIRTPLSPLSAEEFGYCERDCFVMYKGLYKYREKYGSVRNIPLTQTGTVRREVKDILTSSSDYVKFIKKLIPKTSDEYAMLQTIFAGGYTHANRLYSGKVIREHIQHYDFASSYPTVMLAEKYPMSPWIYQGKSKMLNENLFDDWAFCIKVKFSQLKSTSYNTYVQGSKCVGRNFKFDNGRVISCDECEIWITEQDYITIKNNYVWEKMEIIELWKSKKRYLPKPFIEYMLQLYGNKTSLKGVKEMEDIYMQSKQYINSLFGMAVTAIVQSNVLLNNDEWKIEKLTPQYVQEKLDSLRHWNPREKRYFLSYSWGVWVTAYARRNLWKCIESCDFDMLYADTDSIFVIGKKDFSWYDKEITAKIKKACEFHNIDFNLTRPKNPRGIKCPLGVFTSEDDCIEFITLGAKRYVERRTDGKLYLTVSGINKDAFELLCDDIENFKDGFIFDKDSIGADGKIKYIIKDGVKIRAVKKSIPQYLYDMPIVKYPDGYISRYTHGINMRRNGYRLSINDDYKALIKYGHDIDIGEIDDSIYNKLRSRF